MRNFETRIPRIIFENGISGKIGEIAEEIGASKALVVYDKGIKEAGIVTPILESLREKKIGYVEYSEVVPDPKSSDVNTGAVFAKENKIDLVIGIGGGSAMDTAKGIYVLLGTPSSNDILDFSMEENKLPIKCPPFPIILVPTTSGTGSEVSDAAIITCVEQSKKIALTGEKIIPTIALIDPVLDLGVPPRQTASCGMDAFSHAVESYFVGERFNPWADLHALEAAGLIVKYLPLVMREPQNIEYRANVKYACMLAGISIASAGLGIGHGISHCIGGLWHVMHGCACAWSLPFAVQMGAEKLEHNNLERIRKMATAIGVKEAYDMSLNKQELTSAVCEKIKALTMEVGIPTLGSYGEKEEMDMEEIVTACLINPECSLANESEIRMFFEELFQDKICSTTKKC